jgi:glycosyltransferase involved in cell wall biosynthesis
MTDQQHQITPPIKLAVICQRDLDNFLQWTTKMGVDFEVKVFTVQTPGEITEAVMWGDALWFEWANEAAVIGSGSIYVKHKPTIVRLHSYEAFTTYIRKIKWPAVDRLVYVADHVREITEKLHGELPVKSVVIPNGVETHDVPMYHRTAPHHRVGCVGGISHKKNPALALQVLHRLSEVDGPNYTLTWAGAFQDARYEIYLKHMVDRMGLADRVAFLGHVDDMESFWKGVDCLLHTSVHEGHCMAINEALARNIRPVIHEYYGASQQYPARWLYRTVDEAAVQIVMGAEDSEEPTPYADWLGGKKWWLDTQRHSIRNLTMEVVRERQAAA